MFEKLPTPVKDPILASMTEFRADLRAHKIDLGVGVYRDAAGQVPIMRAVKEAERALLEGQRTKTYVGMVGDVAFNHAMVQLVLNNVVAQERVAVVQSVGGSGALRLLVDLIRTAAQGKSPEPHVWLPTPTWPNHTAILRYLDMKTAVYPYLNHLTKMVDMPALETALQKVPRGDVVVLHGCCHNPSGADLTQQQWQKIAQIAAQQGWIPLIDLAYLGFGDGLELDAFGVRCVVQNVPQSLVAVSCSKNFGLYRERVGVAIAVVNAEHRDNAVGALAALARTSYSMPPDHGASVVGSILNNPTLRQLWESELSQIRERMLTLRGALADALAKKTNDHRFDYLRHHRGMFSLMGATQEQVTRLRQDHAIYAVDAGRINIAGLPQDKIDAVAKAIIDIGL